MAGLDDGTFKKTLRKGGPKDLNFYTNGQADLPFPEPPLGLAQYPFDYKTSPATDGRNCRLSDDASRR
jgi:hypothetical protein